MPAEPIVLEGRGRLLPGGIVGPARVTLGEAEFGLAMGGESRVAAYRDLSTIAVQDLAALLVLGSGPGAERFLLDQFGERLGQLVRELHDLRLRQLLADALVDAPADPIQLVAYQVAGEPGVAQLVYHPWGAILAPLDERKPWIRMRRGTMEAAVADDAAGSVTIGPVALHGLAEDARTCAERFLDLRRAAQEDAGRMVGLLVPDAPYAVRREAAAWLVDGRPARPADLPSAWGAIEAGVLVAPSFAASYAALTARAGDLAAERTLAMAPDAPGADTARSWFFVPLPGNLVALELVSEGAHATYLFRAQPRAAFSGGATDRAAAAGVVRDVSEALVDSRFLREPMALPDEQLRSPRYLRYRLALAALPSLAAARARFVARLVHRDDASWAAALDDLIAWHGAARDDGAEWPGRSAQEALVSDAAAGAAESGQSDTPGGS